MDDYLIKEHALDEHALDGISWRLISEDDLRRVILHPEQVIRVRSGRVVRQSQFLRSGKVYLLRVVVDVDREPQEVVTAYFTSKVGKYWVEGA